MEEDIQNYSPTVMFRGTPCKTILSMINRPSTWETAMCSLNKSIGGTWSIYFLVETSDFGKSTETFPFLYLLHKFVSHSWNYWYFDGNKQFLCTQFREYLIVLN